MKKTNFLIIAALLTNYHCFSQDWNGIPIPAAAGAGKQWQIMDYISDSFNYNGKTGTAFTTKWKDSYVTSWKGPGLTNFVPANSTVNGSELQVIGSRQAGTTYGVNCGVVTSKAAIGYPCFIEVSMKPGMTSLANNFWLISADQTREIDIIEIYGHTDWFRRRMPSNYHIFDTTTSPPTDLTGNSHQQFHQTATASDLTTGFNRYGIHWINATRVDFYLNGVRVRELTVDARGTDGQAMIQPMHIVLDTENHEWLTNAGTHPTNAQLSNTAINRNRYNWIRAYKTVNVSKSANLNKEVITSTEFKFYPNPTSSIVEINSGDSDYNVELHDSSGRLVQSIEIVKNSTKQVPVSHLKSGVYLLKYTKVGESESKTEKLVIK
ncbi:T9SS type A sorting domain-containing protein [Flavobacterium sp. ARAG 55.4]|uniref:T9SS type A sorting domain-containing protein n=1 Tax=Flavobacterium sp. ARAG 55.4 TaxID=3451357 RepID=UPI003F46FA43